MKISYYPPQEPLSDFAKPYAAEIETRALEIECTEVRLGENPYQSLSIYQPEVPNGKTLAFIHGGGWTSGYKEWNAFMAPVFTKAGFIFVSIGYRLAPDHIFPSGFEDCAQAMSWLYHNIAEFGGDANQLYVGGHSAGGHYASLLALDHGWKQSANLPDKIVRGCIPVSGTYYFGEQSGLSMRPRFLGDERLNNDALASPINYVINDVPPFLIAYGEKDFPHLIKQSEKMYSALKETGADVETYMIPGSDHLGAHVASGDDRDWTSKMIDWINRF